MSDLSLESSIFIVSTDKMCLLLLLPSCDVHCSNFNLPSNKTLEPFFKYFEQTEAWPPKQVKSKKQTSLAKNILNELGLSEYLHKKTYELSIGQQQRLSIARALINEPKVIQADEPTASLDDENATIVLDLLEKMSKNHWF